MSKDCDSCGAPVVVIGRHGVPVDPGTDMEHECPTWNSIDGK